MKNMQNRHYYHLIDPKDIILKHNLAIAGGRLVAASLQAAVTPGVVSSYQYYNNEKVKEAIWEDIRKNEFATLPSRMGALFLFDDLTVANHTNQSWWGNSRIIMETEIIQARSVGRFDSKLLDGQQSKWEALARKYWSGEMSSVPVPEILVDGVIQLRGWEPYAQKLQPGV